MKKVALYILIVSFPLIANSQNNDSLKIRRIVNEILTNGTAYENLRQLCKTVGHRVSGSPAYQKAVKLTQAMMQSIKPDTVYLQPCMVPHWERGEKERGWVLTNNKRLFDLELLALGLSEGTGGRGVKAQVVEVTSFQQLHQLGPKGIKDKIVFFNFAMDPTYIRTFQAYGESGVARRNGASQAAKYGAKGVMVRSLASNVDPYPHTGAMRYSDSFPKIPAVAISTLSAERLSSELKKGKPVHAYFRTTSRNLPDVLEYNVIGEIRGSERPEEIITVGGHLDSWDVGEGAHDDGAGCMQSIEVIRSLRALGIKPKRTIRAVLFANEESGGKGADKYFDEAKAKNEKHIFAIESDAGGFTPRGISLDMTPEKEARFKRWHSLLAPYGIQDIYKGGSGADIADLKKIGAALAGFNPDSQRYFDVHHAATDVFEAVSRRELLLSAAVLAAVVWLVSEYGL
jgi:carboxypeptidase Q